MVDRHKNGMAYRTLAEPGQQSASHLQLPYINITGYNYQMMQAAHGADPGAREEEEGKGQQLAAGEAMTTPYSHRAQYDDKGMPGARPEATRKSLSRSPGRRKSTFVPPARRQQEITGSLN